MNAEFHRKESQGYLTITCRPCCVAALALAPCRSKVFQLNLLNDHRRAVHGIIGSRHSSEIRRMLSRWCTQLGRDDVCPTACVEKLLRGPSATNHSIDARTPWTREREGLVLTECDDVCGIHLDKDNRPPLLPAQLLPLLFAVAARGNSCVALQPSA